MKKHILITLKFILLFLATINILTINAHGIEEIPSFDTPYNNPSGLAWDGRYLWLSDDTSDSWICSEKGKIIKIDPNNGNVIKVFESPGCDPDGLAWDGNYLWVTDNINHSDRKIFKIDPIDGNITESIVSPGGKPYGLAWDGNYLWVTDLATDKIYRINLNDETFLTINSPSEDSRDLAWDGSYLWLADGTYKYNEKKKIFKIEPSIGVVEYFEPHGPSPDGLAWDGNFLWIVDNDDQKIYKIEVNKLNLNSTLSSSTLTPSSTLSSTPSSTIISTSTQTIDFNLHDINKSSKTAPEIDIESIEKLENGTYQLTGLALHESGMESIYVNGKYVGTENFNIIITGDENIIITAKSNDGNSTMENISLNTDTSEDNLKLSTISIILTIIGLLFGTGLLYKKYR